MLASRRRCAWPASGHARAKRSTVGSYQAATGTFLTRRLSAPPGRQERLWSNQHRQMSALVLRLPLAEAKGRVAIGRSQRQMNAPSPRGGSWCCVNHPVLPQERSGRTRNNSPSLATEPAKIQIRPPARQSGGAAHRCNGLPSPSKYPSLGTHTLSQTLPTFGSRSPNPPLLKAAPHVLRSYRNMSQTLLIESPPLAYQAQPVPPGWLNKRFPV